MNDHWEDMREMDFPSNRIFDALACGTFVISDYMSCIDSLFDGNVVTYDNVNDLDEKIKYYLDNPEKRKSLALNGKDIVLKNHTFDNRVDEIIKSLKTLSFYDK